MSNACKLLALGLMASVNMVSADSLASTTGGQYEFREPVSQRYRIESRPGLQSEISRDRAWLKAWPERAPQNPVWLGARVVLKLNPGTQLTELLPGARLQLKRKYAERLFILQAPDALAAAQEAQRLSRRPGVEACYPVRRVRIAPQGPYAAKPDDPYYIYQWYLENRGEDAQQRGPDLNGRAAWPVSTGQGVQVVVADDGVEFAHPDLGPRENPWLNFNFVTGETNGVPTAASGDHGTAVAGLITAAGNNQLGMTGLAYQAWLSSWVIYGSDHYLVDDEQMANMFEHGSDQVGVQNHSWANATEYLLEVSLLQRTAITNAVIQGRSGQGVVIVRAGGNRREFLSDVNDDGYASSPLVIAVAAVRSDGLAASYSSPGACILVAAPSGDKAKFFPTIFTTDRIGQNGYNKYIYTNDFADYAFDANGFGGTSAATALISGVCALTLSANPNLSYRDVQQILMLSGRHFHSLDPDLATNGAGLVCSHNDGFGVPDAAAAVNLARTWTNRPPATQASVILTESQPIPDDGLRLRVAGPGVPSGLESIRCLPSVGVHADTPSPALPMVYVGLATNSIPIDLNGQAALIERGANVFADKIQHAAEAGAAFAVIYNNRDGDGLVLMNETDYAPIPAVFIGQNDGLALRSYLTNHPEAQTQIRLDSCVYTLHVTNTLQCEHVGLRLLTDHPRRGDLRVTLTSPAGTRSVLQRLNADESAGPVDWTYYSVRHFYESSQGQWTVAVSDEIKDNVGSVNTVELILSGIPILDEDHDGLGDDWEQRFLGNLAAGPKDDADLDGASNLWEYLMQTNPTLDERPLELSFFLWNRNQLRLSWPSAQAKTYDLMSTPHAGYPWSVMTNVPGAFPETVWFTPATNLPAQLLRLRVNQGPW